VHTILLILCCSYSRPPEYDIDEPRRVAEAIHLMKVKHAVITSVNRDELKDRGAEIWYQTVTETKKMSPKTTIETLIPDVKNNWTLFIG
jgi:lipoyl synthase